MRTRTNAAPWPRLEIPNGPGDALEQRLEMAATEGVFPMDELRTLLRNWKMPGHLDPKSSDGIKLLTIFKDRRLQIDDELRVRLVVGHILFHGWKLPKEQRMALHADAKLWSDNFGMEPDQDSIGIELQIQGKTLYLPALRQLRARAALKEVIAAALGSVTYLEMINMCVDYLHCQPVMTWIKSIRQSRPPTDSDLSEWNDKRKSEREALGRAIFGVRRVGIKVETDYFHVDWYYNKLVAIAKHQKDMPEAYALWCEEFGLDKYDRRLLESPVNSLGTSVESIMIGKKIIGSKKTLNSARKSMAALRATALPRSVQNLIPAVLADPNVIYQVNFWSDL